MPISQDNLFFGIKLTEEQRIYANSITDNKVTVVNACAGSGKTTVAVDVAKYLEKKLIYVFAPIQEKQMGFRPGSQAEKEDAYIAPLKCALEEIHKRPERCIYTEDKMKDPRYSKNMMDLIKRGEISRDADTIDEFIKTRDSVE